MQDFGTWRVMDTRIAAWIDGELQPLDKLEVHQRGLRHPAISVFITGPKGILLQRRAAAKYHTPGLWANTCCTHPHWNEAPADCALRRIDEELGITGVDLTWREQVEYRADVGNGLIEHEVVEVFVGHGTPEITINPDEVWETKWMTLEALDAALAATPEVFTPWLRIYLADHRDAIFG